MSISLPQTPIAEGLSPGKPDDFIWRLSVGQYHQMIRTGILTADDPVELLAGWLVYKMPKNPPRRIATRLAQQGLEAVVPAGWYVDAQEPMTLNDSEPEPDVMIVRGETRDYRDRHPGPEDVALIVEVADSTLERDRGVKRMVYARAGIPVYWIINLLEHGLEVYYDPSGSSDDADYGQRRDCGVSDLVPVMIEGRQVGRVAVRDLLP
ncbi:MAG TPA: Uma2 family endonuclease [Blastocatellia bacterium]|nr:Uma2 family endonuclease [Blastocatellia bacterium]